MSTITDMLWRSKKQEPTRGAWLFPAKSFVLVGVSQLCESYARFDVILQSDNGREFSNQVISEVCIMWRNVKIVHGNPRHSRTQGSVKMANQDAQNTLTLWMNDNNTNKLSKGLPFVKFAKKSSYHEGNAKVLMKPCWAFKQNEAYHLFCLANKSPISKPKNNSKK
ncbi:KRAB-A domain-containing protein 2 [Trichonephila clavipes]|nr:KRAB-A domain-containing protein 2 [Trichonephila clavipes]